MGINAFFNIEKKRTHRTKILILSFRKLQLLFQCVHLKFKNINHPRKQSDSYISLLIKYFSYFILSHISERKVLKLMPGCLLTNKHRRQVNEKRESSDLWKSHRFLLILITLQCEIYRIFQHFVLFMILGNSFLLFKSMRKEFYWINFQLNFISACDIYRIRNTL